MQDVRIIKSDNGRVHVEWPDIGYGFVHTYLVEGRTSDFSYLAVARSETDSVDIDAATLAPFTGIRVVLLASHGGRERPCRLVGCADIDIE